MHSHICSCSLLSQFGTVLPLSSVENVTKTRSLKRIYLHRPGGQVQSNLHFSVLYRFRKRSATDPGTYHVRNAFFRRYHAATLQLYQHQVGSGALWTEEKIAIVICIKPICKVRSPRSAAIYCKSWETKQSKLLAACTYTKITIGD